jgi:serine/threonine-protein kinase
VKIQPQPSPTVAEGFVFGQTPDPGTRVNKGNQVTITVSSGKPKTEVPDIRGKSEAEAVAALTSAKLSYKSLQVPNDKPAGEVLAQDPKPGVKLTEGTVVHFTVSKGPTPVTVPSVLSLNVATANSTLQAAGFKVGSQIVDSNQPKDTVVRQDPAGGGSAAKGTTVTIFVSKGPKTSTVPDVSSLDEQSAGQTLHAAGFNVRINRSDTTDPAQDGIVLSQDPAGSTEAKPGSVVTLNVGRLVTQTDTTTTTP